MVTTHCVLLQLHNLECCELSKLLRLHAVKILWHLHMGASVRQSPQLPGCISACLTAGCARQPSLCETHSCGLDAVLTLHLTVAQAPPPQEVIKRITKGARLDVDPRRPALSSCLVVATF